MPVRSSEYTQLAIEHAVRGCAFHAPLLTSGSSACSAGLDAGISTHDAQAEWDSGCHIDWQITESDFLATPRRDLLNIWLWINDVPAHRAAMRILPGCLQAAPLPAS